MARLTTLRAAAGRAPQAMDEGGVPAERETGGLKTWRRQATFRHSRR